MREERQRQYQTELFGWEKAVATIWLLLIAALLIGSTYERLGSPSLDVTAATAGNTEKIAFPQPAGGLLR